MATRKKTAPAEGKQTFILLIRTDKTDAETLHSFEASNEHEAAKVRDEFFAERGERVISCRLA